MIPFFVAVNGGYRTGSTLAYNTVIEILRASAVPWRRCGLVSHPSEVEELIHSWSRHGAAGWWVLKTHVWAPFSFHATQKVKTIYTHRDPIDTAASLIRHSEEWSHVLIEIQRQHLLTGYHRYTQIARIHEPLVLAYETMVSDLPGHVKRVASHLQIPLSAEQVEHVVSRISTERMKTIQAGLRKGAQDPATLTQFDHIGEHGGAPGHGAEILGEERTEAVRQVLRVLS